MLIAGLLLIAVGVVVSIIGFAGGLVGVALAIPIGYALICLGILLAIAGAIVNAIDRQGAAAIAEIGRARDDFKKGTESLWQQLDRIRVGVGGAPQSAAPGPALSPSGVAAGARHNWAKVDEIERTMVDQRRR